MFVLEKLFQPSLIFVILPICPAPSVVPLIVINRLDRKILPKFKRPSLFISGSSSDLIVVMDEMFLDFPVADDAVVVVVVDVVDVEILTEIFRRIFRVKSGRVVGLRHRLRSEGYASTGWTHLPG